MSHPVPTMEYDDEDEVMSDSSRPRFGRKKMSPIVHNRPEFKELRKSNQGINATKKGSIKKSLRRHAIKEVLKNKSK